jgi:hypothetical protein
MVGKFTAGFEFLRGYHRRDAEKAERARTGESDNAGNFGV